MKKFQNGIRRLIRIVRSQKINDLQGFLRKHIDTVKEEKRKTVRTNVTASLAPGKTSSRPTSGKVDAKSLSNLEFKMNLMMDYVIKQSNQMDELQRELKQLRGDKRLSILQKPIPKSSSESDESLLSNSEDNPPPPRKPAKRKKSSESKQRKNTINEDEGRRLLKIFFSIALNGIILTCLFSAQNQKHKQELQSRNS